MRALVFGQTGVCHQKVRTSVMEFAYRDTSRRKIEWICFEDEWLGKGGGYVSLAQRTASDSDIGFRKDWGQAFRLLLQKVKELSKKDPHTDFIISMHASFYRANRFMTPAHVGLIREFKPDICVTLIDDIQDIWHRLEGRNRETPPGGYFHLDEIANWRTVEITVGDMIADACVSGDARTKNYVFAVKHPTINLFRLLFQQDQFVRVYACCGITKTRDDLKLRNAVDAYRERLQQDYIAFDPLTIDEGPIFAAFNGQYPEVNVRQANPMLPFIEGSEQPTIEIKREARWPLTSVDRLVPSVFEEEPSLEAISIPAVEVVRLCTQRDRGSRNVIFDHISQRDLRLVSQSVIVPAWRPHLGGELAGGQTRELAYADDNTIASAILWPEEDREPMRPLDYKGLRYATEEAFYEAIAGIATAIQKHRR